MEEPDFDTVHALVSSTSLIPLELIYDRGLVLYDMVPPHLLRQPQGPRLRLESPGICCKARTGCTSSAIFLFGTAADQRYPLEFSDLPNSSASVRTRYSFPGTSSC